MVAVQDDPAGSGRVFVLRPDFGTHWREGLWVYASVSATALTIAFGYAALGLWPVLPFAGLELLALGAALYTSARRAIICEVVRISGDAVSIERGRRQPEQRWTLERYWTAVEYTPARSEFHPGQLVLRSGPQRVELGAFLGEQDRRRLAQALSEWIGPMAGSGDVPAPAGQPREQ